jgi:hypothetical protein
MFETKTAYERVRDTLDYLRYTNIVTALERNPAWMLARDYVAAAFPNRHAPAYEQFSLTLSLGWYIGQDPNERRRMARALFLLWKAIHHYDVGFTLPVATVGQINQATAQRVLTHYIRKAGCVYDRVNGGHASADRALAEFQAHPRAFLADNKVFVAGSTFVDGAQAPDNVLACRFGYNPGRDRYEFGVRGVVGNGDSNIQVESVTAFHWTHQRCVPRPLIPPPPPLNFATTDFGDMTAIRLGGGHTMVTTQFTGCSFCMAEYNGHMYCAHVAPAGVPHMAPDTNGPALAQRLMENGAFANAGHADVRVYGRTHGHAPNFEGYDVGAHPGAHAYMTVVGFPGGTSYEIFAQTTMNNMISDARQIF